MGVFHFRSEDKDPMKMKDVQDLKIVENDPMDNQSSIKTSLQ